MSDDSSSFTQATNNENSYYSISELKMDNDLTTSISSEIEVPGTRATLTSTGRISPRRVRSLREQESQLQELKKENFGLKLRIYHLEEALRKRHGDLNEDWEMNIQLNVQVDEMKQEMADREILIRDAKNAIDTYEAKINELEKELNEANRAAAEVFELRDAVKRLQQELQQYQIIAEEAQQKAEDERLRGDALEDENNELKLRLAQIPDKPPYVEFRAASVQTDEPLLDKLKLLEEELEQAKKEMKDLRESSDIKDKKIQELELEILRSSNKMAAMATDHAQQMQNLTDEINRLKTFLEEKDEALRQRDREILELNRQLRELQRQLREVTDTAEQLRNKLAAKEEECLEKDKEIEELRKRLRDLQDELERLRNRLNGLERGIRDKDEEIENLKRLLKQKDYEIEELKSIINQMKAELAEKDNALAAARTAAHSTTMNSQEVSSKVTMLTNEIERLREQLKNETKLKNEAEASNILKDDLIAQLRRNIDDLQRKLTDAEERLQHAITTHAAEKNVLQNAIDDLTEQLRQSEAVVRNLRSEIAQLKGERDALRKELEKMRREIADLHSQIAELEQQLKEKNVLLEQSQLTIESLQRLLDELSQSAKPDGVPSAEVAKLRAQIQSQQYALANKDAEISSLKQAVITKDKIIAELQQELLKARNEEEMLKETINVLIKEKEQLEIRIKELEDAAAQNSDAFEQAKLVMEQLQDQIHRLEAQIRDISQVSVSVETTPKKTPTKEEASPGSTNSTTMIIGAVSENLLLLILQKLDELYREIMTGRNEGSLANSSLSAKIDELARLQKQLKSLHRKKGGDDIDFSSTLSELERQNERLLSELETERERANMEGDHKSHLLEDQLIEAKKKIILLEKQLSDNKRYRTELELTRAELERVRKRLDEEEDKNRSLRMEIMELRLSSLQKPHVSSVTSLPDLHANYEIPTHGWTASSFTLGGDKPDLSEVIRKHKEATRLNQELQKKCAEKLQTSPRSRPASAGGNLPSGYWQAKLKQQEFNLKRENEFKEQRLNARLRRLDEELRECERKREGLQLELSSALSLVRKKDEELMNLTTALQASEEKTQQLELKLSQILMEKNRKIEELEQRINELQEHKGMYTPTADGELKNLRRSIASLKSEKAVLLSQLSSCRDQVASLQRELELHQRLLSEANISGSFGANHSSTDLSLDSLLEEIKALRKQLEASLRNNAVLADSLRSHDSSLTTPPRLPPAKATDSSHLRTSEDELLLNISNTNIHQSPFVPTASSTAHFDRVHPRTVRRDNTLDLEAKLRQALNSPTYGGMDREFLQELLLYLQEQRFQLDDSRRLLTHLQQSHDIPTVSHVTVTHGVPQGTTDNDEQDDDRASSRASSIDLSIIHEQLKRTHAAINESKKILKKNKSSHST